MKYSSADMTSYSDRATKDSSYDYKRYRITFITKWSVRRKQMVTTYQIDRINLTSEEFDSKNDALKHAKSIIDTQSRSV